MLAAAVFLTAGLAACQGQDEGRSPDPGDGDATTLTPSDEPTDGEPTDETDPSSSGPTDDRLDAAVTDLAGRLDVSVDDVTAGPLEEVTWSDGSIGCPAPGQSYTQALVPGARATLTVDGTEYAYHGEGEEPLFYCEQPIDPAEPGAETS